MNPSTAQASAVVDELIRGGVREAVLCPGSRNAPLAFALQEADAQGRLRLHMRIDERTAGFLALGLSIASRCPVPIVMTSGTAVANLGPAVLEANYARVPLVVVSANRPYELLGTGANQTIEQFGLFGTQVRATISLGLAEDGLDQNSQWRSAVCRVLAAARGTRSGNAGPVQFDIPLREPLVPDVHAQGPVPQGRPDGAAWTTTANATLDVPMDLDITADTVVISGHGAALRPELAGLPTVAEPTAPLHGIPLHPMALPHLAPRQAVITGRPTLHRSVAKVLADPAVAVFALTTGPRWPDVSGNVVATGTRALVTGTPDPAWIERCRTSSARADQAVRDQLAAHTSPTGLHVAAVVNDSLTAGDQLLLGASNPVRDAALVGYSRSDVRVLSNRGVAGIDGTVSAAVGAALAHEGRSVALLGDLTFLHDASGLLIGTGEPRPTDLTIVVANDDGGGIFELLEQGDPQYSGVFERIFGTPHGMDLAALCAAYRIEHHLVDLPGLAAELAPSRPAAGVRVLEVATERSGLRELHAAVRADL